MRRHLLFLAVILPLTLIANLLDTGKEEAPTASGEGSSESDDRLSRAVA